jgi:hypothetical protein
MQNLFSNDLAPDILPAGSYSVELVSVRPGKGRSFDNLPPKPTITFCFKELSSKTPINRTVAATRDPRGRLLEFVQQLSGSNQPKPEQINDSKKFSQYIETLIGKKFKASVSPSTNGRFNNIVSIYPVEGGN